MSTWQGMSLRFPRNLISLLHQFSQRGINAFLFHVWFWIQNRIHSSLLPEQMYKQDDETLMMKYWLHGIATLANKRAGPMAIKTPHRVDPTTTPVAYCNNAAHCIYTTSCVATYLKLICIHTGQHRTQETTAHLVDEDLSFKVHDNKCWKWCRREKMKFKA
jgi:hypothetical protein